MGNHAATGTTQARLLVNVGSGLSHGSFTFHANTQISASSSTAEDATLRNIGDQAALFTPDVHALIIDLLCVDQVTSLRVGSHHIKLFCSKSTDVDDIYQVVADRIVKHLGWSDNFREEITIDTHH